MDKRELMATIATTFKKGAASTIVVRKSADSSMNKGRGMNVNPFIGRVIIEKTYNGYVMGTDYQNSILGAASRMGNDDADANLKKVWHKPTATLGEWFYTDKATESKVYLKLQRNAKQVGCKTTETYYVDGHVASEMEVAQISAWMKKKTHTMSSTQVELGLDKEHEQHFILPQLDTIILIKQGNLVLHPSYAMVGA